MGEILKKIVEMDGLLVALITGAITFLITKYSYHKSIPLDKMEIAYNRVYYPIRCLLKKGDGSEIVEKSEKYLKKYDKYVDGSTLVAYRFLKRNPNDKKAYENYENNIYNINSRLRRKLGYLDANLLSLYIYSAPNEKRVFRMTTEIVFIYILAVGYTFINQEVLKQGIVILFSIVFVVFIIELAMLAIMWIKYKIGRICRRYPSKE